MQQLSLTLPMVDLQGFPFRSWKREAHAVSHKPALLRSEHSTSHLSHINEHVDGISFSHPKIYTSL